jgi:hypothetical protein
MRSLGLAVIAFVVLGACESSAVDSPEVVQRKAACRQLNEHLFRISPESRASIAGVPEADQRKRIDQLMAKVAVEDIEQCAAADPKVVACMQAAADIAAVRGCIPPAK